MQDMLDNLSQPVAFATVPLGDAALHSNRSQAPLSSRRDLGSDTDNDEPVLTRFTRRIGISRDAKKAGREHTSISSSRNGDDGLDGDVFDEG